MRLFSLKRAAPTSQATNPHTLPEQSCHEQPCHENIPYEQCLYKQCLAEQLHGRLLDLDFPAFALCLCRLLEALGYQDVHLAGRREWKGYNKPGGGGYDLEATLPSRLFPLTAGISPRRVIAQIKQFDGLHVHQRSVDELRGACLRVGAAEALLITTSAFSKVARAGATAPSGAGSTIAPMRLMDGEELIVQMIRHRLGVKECKLKECNISARNRGLARLPRLGNKASNKASTDDKLAEKQWEIDDTFFAELALASAILGKAPPTKHQTKHQNPTKRQSPTTPPNSTPRQNLMRQNLTQWRVTVRISSNSKGDKQKEDEQKKGHQKEGHQKGGG